MVKKKRKLQTVADVLCGQSSSCEVTVGDVLRDQSFSREGTVSDVLRGRSLSREETVADGLHGQSSSCEDTNLEPDILEHAIAISTHIPTSDNALTKRRGRGCGLGIRGWGSVVKANVLFDDSGHPVGHREAQLKSTLGQLVRNGSRFPLTYLKWESIPQESKDFIWREVQENLKTVPPEFKDVCLKICGKIWRNHKSKTKSMYFNPYMDNPSILSITPPGVVEEQWKQMVLYWLSDRGKAISLRQARNRAKMGPSHTTGRTNFSQLRYKIQQEGGSVDKMSLYLASHDINNPEVAAFAAEYDKKICDIQDADRTIEARDRIYDEIYCRTFRTGVIKPKKVSLAVYEAEIAKLKTTQDSMMQDIAFLRERLASIESQQGKSLEKQQRRSLELQQGRSSESQQESSSESQQEMSSTDQHVMMYTRALRSQSTMPKNSSLQTPMKTPEKNKKRLSTNLETRDIVIEEILPIKKRKKTDEVEKYEKLIKEAKLKAQKTMKRRKKN